MSLLELAYQRGAAEAFEKFAMGQMFRPAAPPPPPMAASPISSVVGQKAPPAVGPGAAPAAPIGMPSATANAGAPAMGLQSSPVLGTGQVPNPTSAIAGQTASQSAATSFQSHGQGK